MQWQQNGIIIVDEKAKVNLDVVHRLLKESYWANTRGKETIAKSVEHSLCFSAWKEKQQVGFARVVSDYATFAWIADIIVDPEFRGHGIGKFLMRCITDHPMLQTTKQTLCTKDAHGLYEQFNFTRKEFMVRPG